MRITIVATLALCCVTAAIAQQNDWIIVPGKRLGPITAETDHATLVRLFGNGNLNDRDFDTGEGIFEPATVVFAKDPSAALAVLWRDRGVDRVFVCFESRFGPCKWHTQDGVSLGTGLPTLEALNGRPFVVNTWGWDLQGIISSWEGGRLAGEFGDRGNFQVSLALYYQQPTSGPTPQQKQALDEIGRLRRNPLSSDSAMRKLRPTVIRMELFFPNKNPDR